jgi:gamma-glutamylcyclotransferase (GGCT)/AIG2-like uncharacterized protein YtfP
MVAEPPRHLFTYGTLMPGHLRWGLLRPGATGWGEAEVAGELWDTGQGWPAARFHAVESGVTAAGVPGWWVEFEPGVLDGLLGDLDTMEGIGEPPDPSVDPYVRVQVDLPGVGGAWASHATRISPAWRRIERWDGQAEA